MIKLKSLKLPPWKEPLWLKKKVGKEERYRMSVAQLIIFSNWWRNSFVAKDVHNGAHMDCYSHTSTQFICEKVCTYCSSKTYSVQYWKQNNKRDFIKYHRDYEIPKVIKLTEKWYTICWSAYFALKSYLKYCEVYIGTRFAIFCQVGVKSLFLHYYFFKAFLFEANYVPPSIFSKKK